MLPRTKPREAAGMNYGQCIDTDENILMTFVKQWITGQASLNSFVVVERRIRLGKKFTEEFVLHDFAKI